MRLSSFARRAAAWLAGGSALVAALGLGPGVAAFGGHSPHYYDIGHVTPLAQRAAVSLYEEGVMNGTAPGKFSPYGVVTRAQAVKFVVKALGLSLAQAWPTSYADVSPRSAYFAYVEAADRAGILNGMAPATGMFDPSTAMSRIDFALLATNALHDGGLAASMAGDRSTYGYLRDLAAIPPADLGAANAMMKVGIVPPLTSRRYAPFARLNREEFAVAMMRLDSAMSGTSGSGTQAAASLSLSAALGTVPVHAPDSLSVVIDRYGRRTPIPARTPYVLHWAVAGGPAEAGRVDARNAFSATQPGTYTITVVVSGDGLTHALEATTRVRVVAATAAALRLTPESVQLVANDVATASIRVAVVGATGNQIPFNGSVVVRDSGRATRLVGANSALATELTTIARDGVATVRVRSLGAVPGVSDVLTAQATIDGRVETGRATVTTEAQRATSVRVRVSPRALTTDGGVATVSAVVLDQTGEPMLTGSEPLTLTVRGGARFLNGSSATYVTFRANGSANPPAATAQIRSENGSAGSVVVRATGPAGITGELSAPIVAAVAGTPNGLSVRVAAVTVQPNQNDTLTITLIRDGRVVTAPSPVTVLATWAGETRAAATIPAGGRSTYLTFREGQVGAYLVRLSGRYVESGRTYSLSPASVVINVEATAGASAPVALIVRPAATTVKAGQADAITVTLVNSRGQAVAAPTPVTVYATYGSGQRLVGTIRAGAASTFLEFSEASPGMYRVSVTGTYVEGTTHALGGASAVITVEAAASLPTALSVSAAHSILGPGQGDTITVQLVGSTGRAIDAPANATVRVTSSNGESWSSLVPAGTSTTTLAFAFARAGTYTLSTEATYSLSGAAHSIRGPNLRITVSATAPTTLSATAAHNSVAPGTADAITVDLVDGAGNPVPALADVAVSATWGSGQRAAGTIVTGQSSVVLTFKDATAGSYPVAIAGSYGENGQTYDLVGATVDILVGTPAAALSIEPAGPTAGAPVDVAYRSTSPESVPVTVQLESSTGKAVAQSGVPVTLTATAALPSGSTASTLASIGTHGSTATLDTDANGRVITTLSLVSPVGTTWTLKATESGQSTAQTFVVVQDMATAATVSLADTKTNSSTEATAGDKVQVAIATQDAKGQTVANGDYLEVAVSPADGFAADGAGNVALTWTAGTGATLVGGTNNLYLVKTDAFGKVAFTATAATAGLVTVTATDVSVPKTFSGQNSIGVVASSTVGGAALFDTKGDNLALTPLAVSAGKAVEVTLRITDAEGNPITASTAETVGLSDLTLGANGRPTATAGGGSFSTAFNGAPLAGGTVSVPAGATGVVLWYTNPKSGSYFLDAALK